MAMIYASFPEKLRAFFVKQSQVWLQLKEGIDSLQHVQEKTINLGGFSLQLQFNPRRIISTSAVVEVDFVRKRKCFLCEDNLPAEQMWIEYKNQFRFLCNPFPILPEHFTVVYKNHVEQQISDYFNLFLDISKDVSPRYWTFYNGPQCGASAPDHLHFQIANGNNLPILNEINIFKNNGSILPGEDDLFVSIGNFNMRSVVLIQSGKKENILLCFENLVAALSKFLNVSGEPMMNIACFYENGKWNILIFLREKHRPECYFAEGQNKLLISPAVIDLCGCLVIPREKDFEKIDTATIKQIYKEVAYPDDKMSAFKNIFKQLQNKSAL
ncbi:MAG: DUF4922 domain-containing protein [bacterium]